MIQRGEHSRAQKELLAGLRDRVQVHGFSEKFSKQSYYCLVPEGKLALHVSFIRHRDDLDLTADVAVRIDCVENLVNSYDTKRTPTEKRDSMTLGGELGNISEGQFRRWTVATFDDIPGVCDEVQKTFERVGLPFLTSHSNISAAFRVLVGSRKRDHLLAPILGPRCMRAVASAYITGAADLDALIAQYEAELLDSQDLYLEDFRALCRGILSADMR